MAETGFVLAYRVTTNNSSLDGALFYWETFCGLTGDCGRVALALFLAILCVEFLTRLKKNPRKIIIIKLNKKTIQNKCVDGWMWM